MKTFMAVYTGNPAALEKYQQQFPQGAGDRGAGADSSGR